VVYVIGSLTSTPTDPEVLAEWDSRGESTARMTMQQNSVGMTEPMPPPTTCFKVEGFHQSASPANP
jgi:hypothetical protein